MRHRGQRLAEIARQIDRLAEVVSLAQAAHADGVLVVLHRSFRPATLTLSGHSTGFPVT
jgi:hypothetical protein